MGPSVEIASAKTRSIRSAFVTFRGFFSSLKSLRKTLSSLWMSGLFEGVISKPFLFYEKEDANPGPNPPKRGKICKGFNPRGPHWPQSRLKCKLAVIRGCSGANLAVVSVKS